MKKFQVRDIMRTKRTAVVLATGEYRSKVLKSTWCLTRSPCAANLTLEFEVLRLDHLSMRKVQEMGRYSIIPLDIGIFYFFHLSKAILFNSVAYSCNHKASSGLLKIDLNDEDGKRDDVGNS